MMNENKPFSRKIIPISYEYMSEALTYDDEGRLYWREDRPASHFKSMNVYRQWHGRFAGKEAFTSVNKTTGYKQGRLCAELMMRGYVVFVLSRGKHPVASLKRRDGDKLNDRPSNLYEYGHG